MVFDKHGKVKDDASPALFEIRMNLKTVKKQINRKYIHRTIKINERQFFFIHTINIH